MNGFIETITWSGRTVDLDVLREIVRRTDGQDGATRVQISIDPRTGNASDPGGTITIAVTGDQSDRHGFLGDIRPHSRACGFRVHPHGSQCHANCPTCHGSPLQ